MIVKCQISLETTEPEPQMLFYDQQRKWTRQFNLTPEWKPYFRRYRKRFFARVVWIDRRRPPRFLERLPEQHW